MAKSRSKSTLFNFSFQLSLETHRVQYLAAHALEYIGDLAGWAENHPAAAALFKKPHVLSVLANLDREISMSDLDESPVDVYRDIVLLLPFAAQAALARATLAPILTGKIGANVIADFASLLEAAEEPIDWFEAFSAKERANLMAALDAIWEPPVSQRFIKFVSDMAKEREKNKQAQSVRSQKLKLGRLQALAKKLGYRLVQD